MQPRNRCSRAGVKIRVTSSSRWQTAAVAVETAIPASATRLACAEVQGGNHEVNELVDLPGLRGVLYSSPCAGSRGGDVHYLSVCGSGLLARVCLADVAGHGEAVAAVGAEMHRQLRLSVDTIDERRILRTLDRRLVEEQLAITTAAVLTYYAPARRLTVSYAGHPRGWIYRAGVGTWERLEAGDAGPAAGSLVDLPLGTGLTPGFARRKQRLALGDRILLVTDGVLDACSPADEAFGASGVDRVVATNRGTCEDLGQALLHALQAHTGRLALAHDDVTFFLAEIVEGPAGPALWHVIRHRLLKHWVR